MMIAEGVGSTFQLGKFTVRIALRPDNPAFAKFVVFRGDRLIGTQFSRPNESDCKWLEQWGTEYAAESFWVQTSSLCQRLRGGGQTHKRGRPRKEDSERELQEALAS